jgi:hypothetical protein
MRIKPTLVLACVLSAFSAAHARAQTVVQVSSSKGTQASTFIEFGPTVICADGSVGTASGFGFVSGAESISHSPGSPKSISNGGLIEIFDYSDSCTGTFIGFAIGGLSGGYTAPHPNLASAALSGTTSVQELDSDTGASYPVSIDLVFTANGPSQKFRSNTASHDFPGYTVVVSRNASNARDAGVTGTITINGLEPDASFSTTVINSNTSGQTTVYKQ